MVLWCFVLLNSMIQGGDVGTVGVLYCTSNTVPCRGGNLLSHGTFLFVFHFDYRVLAMILSNLAFRPGTKE